MYCVSDVLGLVSHLVFLAAYGVSVRAGRRFLEFASFCLYSYLHFYLWCFACLTSVYAILILFFVICVVAQCLNVSVESDE